MGDVGNAQSVVANGVVDVIEGGGLGFYRQGEDKKEKTKSQEDV